MCAATRAARHNCVVSDVSSTEEAVSEEEARRYAQHVAPTFVTLARRAVDLAGIEAEQSVLDLCTGTGIAAFLAAERAGRDGSVIGLDASQAMLDIARERSAAVGYDFIAWHQGDAAQLAYADESFDAVLCVQGLMHLPRPDAALEEGRRVLVEGGRLVLTTWGGRVGNEWATLLDDALRRVAGPGAVPRSAGLSQPGNVEALLQAIGFTEIESARVPDRMRFQGVEGFWEWARAAGRWGRSIVALAPAAQERVFGVLEGTLRPRVRDGELAVSREIVYARAIAPTAP